jgi:hypothetical protein
MIWERGRGNFSSFGRFGSFSASGLLVAKLATGTASCLPRL